MLTRNRAVLLIGAVSVLLLGGVTDVPLEKRWVQCQNYDALLAAADPILLHGYAPNALTLERITCAVSGTETPTLTITTQSRSLANGSAVELESGTVCDEDGTTQTTAFTATAIAALSYLTIDVTAVGGTTRTRLLVCLSGR
jgi:hypothetical protein